MCQIDKMKIRRRCKTPEEPYVLYIVWKGETLGICKQCWERFPDDLEWGESPKSTIEEILSDKSRGLEGAIETEYRFKEKKLGEQTKEDEDFE